MGSFFTVVDDPKNERVIMYRADSAIDNAIYLDTDPTGTALPFPDVLDKVDMGSATNKAGFTIPYKDGVKLKITTNLPATAAIGDTLSLVWTGGSPPFDVRTEAGTTLYDVVTQPGRSYSFNTTGKAAGTYKMTVKDTHGVTVVSGNCVVS
ncbi:hypothetical protein AB3H13_27015 [Escherichia coli]|uniref:hypothetical protein n=1 Tax=Escherichia coli TaxID=562 RepID=UPI0019802356|nr:hypothetical protein [Citrobacter freundii]HAV8709238.1 hypothetical protein [Escherichia coli]HCI0273567.1 hypothetical protein [Escherichia coli]HCI3360030.1 hypothetical protein [Escherichia coli]HCI3410972.1 hypothetical protein [Escherichia coli]